MGSRAKDKLRWLLKKYEIQTPPDNFTAEVIREIDASANEQVVAPERLKALLRKDVPSLPSASFTYQVVNKARQQSQAGAAPVISKKVWGLITGFMVVCGITAITMESGELPTSKMRYTFPIAEYLSNITLKIIDPLFYFVIIVASAAMLLAIDYLFRRERNREIRE